MKIKILFFREIQQQQNKTLENNEKQISNSKNKYFKQHEEKERTQQEKIQDDVKRQLILEHKELKKQNEDYQKQVENKKIIIEHLKADNVELKKQIKQLQDIVYEIKSTSKNLNSIKKQLIQNYSEQQNDDAIQEQQQQQLSHDQTNNMAITLNLQNQQQKNEQYNPSLSFQYEQKQIQKCQIQEISQNTEFQNYCGHKITLKKLEDLLIKGLKWKNDPLCQKCQCKLSNWSNKFPHLKIKIDEEINKYNLEKLIILYEQNKQKQKKLKLVKCQKQKCKYYCFWDDTSNYTNESYAFCQNCESKTIKKP